MVFSQLSDSCGEGEAFRSGARRPSSLAPSGRHLLARTAWALSPRCVLPRSRFPDALRPAGPRSGSSQPPHVRGHSLSALGSIWFATRPLRPSQGCGGCLTQSLSFFTGGIRDLARPLIGARAATRAHFSGCLPGASTSGLSWADPERIPRTVVKKEILRVHSPPTARRSSRPQKHPGPLGGLGHLAKGGGLRGPAKLQRFSWGQT